MQRYRGNKLSKTRFSNFWWIDATLPLVFVLILFIAITNLTYTGTKHRRLSMIFEFQILEMHLLLQSILVEPKPSDKIALITVTQEDDIKNLPNVEGSPLADLDIQEYVKIIEKIYTQNPELIIIHWLEVAHRKSQSRTYYEPLINLLQKIKNREKILIAVPENRIDKLPKELRELATIVDSDRCSYRGEPICPYNDAWDTWGPQALIKYLSKTTNYYPLKRALSSSFSDSYLGYITNIDPPDILLETSATNFMKQETGIDLKGKLVFVGTNYTKQINVNEIYRSIRPQLTFYTKKDPIRYPDPIPIHKFYALISKMHLDKSFIATPSKGQYYVILAVFCFAVFFALIRQTIIRVVYWAFGIFFVLTLISIISLFFFKAYVPLFSIYYFGFFTVLLVAFSKLSLVAIGQWQTSAKKIQRIQKSDLRNNFISLLSHNLNTPVAKMQGMIDVLSYTLISDQDRNTVSECKSDVAKLELCIKAILLTTALEENGLTITSQTLDSLIEEFDVVMGGILKRYGIKVNHRTIFSEDDLEYLPFGIDKKALSIIIASHIVYLAKANITSMDIDWYLDWHQNGSCLICSIFFPMDAIDPVKLRDIDNLISPNRTKAQAKTGPYDFLQRVYLILIAAARDKFNLKYQGETQQNQKKIQISVVIPT